MTRRAPQKSPPGTVPGLWVIGSVLAVAITSLIGTNATYFAPIEIGAIIDQFNLSAAKGGAFVSIELGFVAFISLTAATWLSRVDTRRIAIAACLFTAAVNVACAFPFYNIAVLMVLRALAGTGAGVAFAICCIWTARSAQPARMYGITIVLVSVVTAAAMLPLSSLAAQYGLQAVFLLIGLILFAATLPLFWLQPPQRSGDPTSTQSTEVHVTKVSRMGLYVAVVLSNVALSIIWQFAERLGNQYGYSATNIAAVLSVSVIAGIGGSVVAAVVGDRFGYAVPLLAGLVTTIGCGVLVSVQSGYIGYAIAIALSEFGFLFILPFLIGFGSWLDASGKSAAWVGGLALTASAISPIVGGVIVDRLSVQASGWACAVFALVAIIALLPIALTERTSRRHNNFRTVIGTAAAAEQV